MRILVTGGAGYIGSHTVRLLKQRGHEVWVYDDLSAGHAQAVPGVPLIVGNLQDAPKLDAALQTIRADAVAHFAGLIDVHESLRNPLPFYGANVGSVFTLLDVMVRHQVPRLVLASTCAVYSPAGRTPLNEMHHAEPATPYGHTKRALEWLLSDCAQAYGIGCTALRFFNAAGADPTGRLGEDHRPENHLIPSVLQVAMGQRREFHLRGIDYPTPDGTCVRDFVHVNDLAEAFLTALERITAGEYRCYNLGSGRGWSVREVLRVCGEVTAREIPVIERTRRDGDAPSLVADSELAHRLLDWSPRFTDLREIVETAWRWHRDHPRGFPD